MTVVLVALQTSDLRKRSSLFDIDRQWSMEPNFVLYDFNNPEDIPINVHKTFDCVVIDPPFITEEVWTLYAAAAKVLLAPEGEILYKSWQSLVSLDCTHLRHVLVCCPAAFVDLCLQCSHCCTSLQN